ncbi:PD-(D/E)XK nuclease family protein [Tenacibaculum ovolyticum]|uniref:PD-(D/E)XK nuclease family protein n=1 Tax=Tenacibaculum ovolyticum TaxID=104270 RepID=UPI0007ECD215|nr:PD-(D/E)XK nuclease family protein [Tenacibaculum ovolyticum]
MLKNIEKLQTFLNKNELPKIKRKPKTFLSIAKQPHYENVISNLYAFYFRVNEVHKLKDLFISSLLEIVNTKTKTITSFNNFEVLTEYVVSNQNRIDLLLQNNQQAIIIENKVYHHLNNDLPLYYNNVEAINKLGIVLSLFPVSNIGHSHFINITHLELLNTIMSNLENYLLNANDKYVVFLKDFHQNITNLSLSYMEKENIVFYYKNQQKINQLVQFKFKLREHIKNEVVRAGESLDNLNKYEPRINSFNDKRLVYYVSPKHTDLMITVVYEGLLEPKPTMYIAVELQGDLLKDRSVYNTIDTFTEEELEIAYSDNFKNTNESWAHFAVKHYQPTNEEISNLATFIIHKLEEDNLLPVFRKLENFLNPPKK